MQVLKFGGSSLADIGCLEKVASLIKNRITTLDSEQLTEGTRLLLVLSAPGGMTDQLVELADLAEQQQDYSSQWQNLQQRAVQLKQQVSAMCGEEAVIRWPELEELEAKLKGIALLGQCPDAVKAYVISFGERISVALMQALLKEYDPVYMEATACITSNSDSLNAVADIQKSQRRFKTFTQNHPGRVYIMPGFTAANEQGELTTLGRNGSDYSAAVAAACLQAEICQIWTDVDGVYSADPRFIPGACKIDTLSYKEAMELSYFGAKVLHPKTITPCAKAGVLCEIKNTHAPNIPGTLIGKQSQTDKPVKAISSLEDLCMITVSGPGMKGKVGMASRVFGALAKDNVSIVLITQSSCEFSISFCIHQHDFSLAQQALSDEFELEAKAGIIEPFQVKQDLAIVTLVGDNMKAHKGLAAKFFASMSQAQVNIVAIAQDSTEGAISAVVDSDRCNGAVKVCHEQFFTHVPSIDVFIVGCGLVGSELIAQINRQRDWLKERNVKLTLYGVANSRQLLLDENGIDPDNWQVQLADVKQSLSLTALNEFVSQQHLINPVIVDCTSSDKIASQYAEFLTAGYHVVAANKKATTDSYEYYQKLKHLSRVSGRKFLYETNVGAGLPVLDNLQLLFGAGDQLVNFSGILSGSLSYMFGALEEGLSLSEATYKAKENGFTEPDPRDDLSGTDVARKLLIIAREAGLQLELKDIHVDPVLPLGFAENASIEEFLAQLPQLDADFKNQVSQAKAKGKVLRYVGRIENGQCQVGIEAVGAEHPLYDIKEGENALAILSQYYQPKPYVIRGYGAGAAVTAAGVFADVLKTLSRNQGVLV